MMKIRKFAGQQTPADTVTIEEVQAIMRAQFPLMPEEEIAKLDGMTMHMGRCDEFGDLIDWLRARNAAARPSGSDSSSVRPRPVWPANPAPQHQARPSSSSAQVMNTAVACGRN